VTTQLLLAVAAAGLAQAGPPEIAPPPRRVGPEPLDLAPLVARPVSEAAAVVRWYEADRGSLTRAYAVPFSTTRTARLTKFHADWLAALKEVDADKLTPAAREELAGLRAAVEGDLRRLEAGAAADEAIRPLLPFAEAIVRLEEARRRMEPVDGEKAAGTLAGLPKVIDRAVDLPDTKKVATRAADAADRLRASLKAWFGFYDGYDPLFTWWVGHPYKQADAALERYAKAVREKAAKLPDGDEPKGAKPVGASNGRSDAPDLTALLAGPRSELIPVLQRYQGDGGRRSRPAGRDPARWLAALEKLDFDRLSRDAQVEYVLFRTHLKKEARLAELRAKEKARPVVKDESGISGRPIGREAVLAELAGEMIPYTPEELIALARAELDWCDAEVRRASREMGYGDDWQKAVEKVKTLHVRPGEQPKLIRDLAVEAVEYLNKHDLVTVPPLAAETWRMAMMSPERQLVNPFFTGGEVITVSYPTNAMSHEAKLQSMRGNNPHFSRATVHHELIPGHHLQGFTTSREKPHRGLFGTAFWGEGWAVYWEMVLYDRGFPATPEDRVGFLVWRMHRCARVIFSLGFHLGRMTPKECVDLLTSRVGFEPDNAAAEVRRSFGGGYGPMYQAAYLLGAMQFRALRKELVGPGKMTERDFHDAILKENRIPVEMVRAILTGRKLTRDYEANWKFGDR
jgi:uncharacterized protein (DUF885 family)